VSFSLFTTAQNLTWEVGGGFGSSNYFGDIGGVKPNGQKGPADIMLKSTGFSFSGFTRRMIDYRFYAKAQLSYIYISGDDKLSPNTGRTTRNLNFHNNMVEALAMMEYHPLIINDLGGRRRFVADLHVFVATGFGVLYSDPIGKFGATNVKLRPLATEGPDNIYSPIQIVIPMSTGFFVSFKGKYSGYRVHRVGININYRVTFTDYLDDVSTVYPDAALFADNPGGLAASYRGYQTDPNDPNLYPEGKTRGNPNSNDGYLTTMIYYSKRIRSGQKKHKLPRRQEFYGRTRRIKKR
tara:strand:- start:170847 stop:171731 length:885 start_codon:yes stop_codon:yes gene_type:complete